MSTTTTITEPYSRLGTTVIAHRSSRIWADRFVARYANCLGETDYWNGCESVPVTIVWAVEPVWSGGFDIVSTVTAREVHEECEECGHYLDQEGHDVGCPLEDDPEVLS